MAQTVTYDPSDANLVLATRRPEDSEFVESALFGAAESGKVIVDDDDAAIDIVGLKRLEVIESSAPSGDQRIWTAFVGTRPYRRSSQVGPVGPNAREIEIQATEINTALSDVFVTGVGGNRPRERASARLAWILASGFVACGDRGKVVYPETWLDANDYRNSPGGAVIADIASATGYDWTTLLDDEGETVPELFFDDFDRSEVYSTTAKISNAGDDDGTTIFAPDEDASEELQRNPENVSSDAIATYAKGNVHQTNAATAARFRTRYAQVGSSTAKTAEQAKRLATNWLNDHDEEEDTITVGFLTNPADVNKFRRGQRCQVKLTYAPGLTDYTWCRIMTRRVTQPVNHDLKYHLSLDLKPQRPICVNPNEILEAHATVTAAVVLEAGTTLWAHASISGWFGGPVDTAVDTIPISDPTNANDGDPTTFSAVDQQTLRNGGTVAARWEAELDGTYELCRVMGTVEVGSDSWQSRPPDRIEYFDPDASAWVTLPGGYTYGPTTPVPRYWTKAAAGVHATKLALVYEQTGVPGILGLWGWMPLGVRVYDWLAYGDPV